MINKIDVTVSELRMLLNYASKRGQGDQKFITLHLDRSPVFDVIGASENWTSEVTWMIEEDGKD